MKLPAWPGCGLGYESVTRPASTGRVWLVEKMLNRLIEPDCSEIRKAIAAKELVTFETTLVAHHPPARFEDAAKAAGAATRESEEANFVAAIDIARARMAQIRPLASHDPVSSTGGQTKSTVGMSPKRSFIRFRLTRLNLLQ